MLRNYLNILVFEQFFNYSHIIVCFEFLCMYVKILMDLYDQYFMNMDLHVVR